MVSVFQPRDVPTVMEVGQYTVCARTGSVPEPVPYSITYAQNLVYPMSDSPPVILIVLCLTRVPPFVEVWA